MLGAIDPTAARQLKVIASNVTLKQRRYASACTIQRVYRGHLGRKYARARRNLIERDCQRLREAWRAFQFRQKIDRAFRGYEAEYIKTFFQALGYNGEQQETTIRP